VIYGGSGRDIISGGSGNDHIRHGRPSFWLRLRYFLCLL
jgi:hypothetical protein